MSIPEGNYRLHIVFIGVVILTANFIMIPNLASARTLETMAKLSESPTLPHFKVGNSPLYMEIGDLPHTVYVVNEGSQSVSAIDVDTMTVSDIPVGTDPVALADPYAPDKTRVNPYAPDKVYVVNRGSDNVSVINKGNNTELKKIPVGDRPVAIATVSIGSDLDDINKVYVANSNEGTVSVIDATKDIETTKIPVGNGPLAITQIVTDVYVANADGTVSVIDATKDVERARIRVGHPGGSLAITGFFQPLFLSKVYVAHPLASSAVSVIDAMTLGTKNITVGKAPSAFAVDEINDRLFVANSNEGTVSVIDATKDVELARIPVGGFPSDLAVDTFNSKLFAMNSENNTVTVIDVSTENLTEDIEIETIPVGDLPRAIRIDRTENTVYVANEQSDSVTVINSKTDEMMAGVSFDVQPFHGGRVVCGKLTVPTNQHFYVDYAKQCKAEANKGFQFTNWMQNLGPNSTRIINASEVSESIWSPILTPLGYGFNDPSANLTVTEFGNFTANFEKLPPPLPDEYVILLVGIIASSIIGWSIPSIVGGIKTKRQDRKLNSIHKKINHVWNDGRLDLNDLKRLESLVGESEEAYVRGKINNERYMNLRTNLSVLYEEIFRKRIDLLSTLIIRHDIKGDRLLSKIKYEINDAYAKGKLSKIHYEILNKTISDYEGEE